MKVRMGLKSVVKKVGARVGVLVGEKAVGLAAQWD